MCIVRAPPTCIFRPHPRRRHQTCIHVGVSVREAGPGQPRRWLVVPRSWPAMVGPLRPLLWRRSPPSRLCGTGIPLPVVGPRRAGPRVAAPGTAFGSPSRPKLPAGVAAVALAGRLAGVASAPSPAAPRRQRASAGAASAPSVGLRRMAVTSPSLNSCRAIRPSPKRRRCGFGAVSDTPPQQRPECSAPCAAPRVHRCRRRAVVAAIVAPSHRFVGSRDPPASPASPGARAFVGGLAGAPGGPPLPCGAAPPPGPPPPGGRGPYARRCGAGGGPKCLHGGG